MKSSISKLPVWNKKFLQEQILQVIVAPHLFNWRNRWKGPDDLDNFHLAKCFDAEAAFEICVLPDEPTLTRFKVFYRIFFAPSCRNLLSFS